MTAETPMREHWTLAKVQREAYDIAEAHGFHDVRTSRAEALALIHSEASEALEADRADEPDDHYAEELADIVIRVADHAEEVGVDLEQAVIRKMRENRERDYRHGKDY